MVGKRGAPVGNHNAQGHGGRTLGAFKTSISKAGHFLGDARAKTIAARNKSAINHPKLFVAKGAAAGALLGSVLPGLGTISGAVIGGAGSATRVMMARNQSAKRKGK